MARLDQRHPANVAGDWFVDTRCIDCDSCRILAPDLFGESGYQSVVAHQPSSPSDAHRAWLAAEACPTQSIGTAARPRQRAPADLYPSPLTDDVYLCGHHAESSFGACSYLMVRPGGNLLVDAPRFTRRLVGPIRGLGGIAHVLLTHRDDVADAGRYADAFGARVWIHADDRPAAPFATDVVPGLDEAVVAPDVTAVPVPGHTQGSMLFVVDERYLFSGDSLAWDRQRGDLTAFRGACWYSWTAQTESLQRLWRSDHRFGWVLPGHGDRVHRAAPELHDRLGDLTARMAGISA